MKKKIIIILSIILIIIIGIIIFLIIKARKNTDYELLKVSEYKFWNLTENDKEGVIRRDGHVIIEPEYDSVQIPNQDKPIFIVKKGDEIFAYNDAKEKIFNDYDEVDVISFSKEGRTEINNTVLKYKEKGKYGLVGFDEKKITGPVYDEIDSLEDKLGEIRVKKNGKYGVINVNGKTILKCKYDFVKGDGFFEDGGYKTGGYIVGNKNDDGMKYGYLNREGKSIIKIEQESLYRVTEIDDEEAYLVASKNGRYAVYKNKENISDYKYININYNKDSETFTVQKNKKYGLLRKDAEEIIKPEYDNLLVAGEYVNVYKGEKGEIFDLNGEKVEEPEYVSLEKTKTEKYYIAMNKDFKYGILDVNKNKVIELKYDYIEQINNTDLILATEGKNLCLYSASINEIISAENAQLNIVNGYIKITSNDENISYFTMDGKEIDNRTVYVNNEIYAQKTGDKWGFVNIADEVVVDNIYDEVTEVNEYGFAGVKVDGKWGVINSKGEIILEPTYESNIKNPVFIGKYYKNGNKIIDKM